MSQVINTNALSLMAQNNLNKSQSALGTTIQRLSSGLRINSAKDDAAGQAISNRFTASVNGLTQASRNANDGISLAQTTEGALNEVNDNLQNIRRLTVQAQNGTNSVSDRQSIQDEINQRLDEINRISEQTEFNGVKVLSEEQTLTIQVGANDGQIINIDLSKIDASSLDMSGFDIMGPNAADLKAATDADFADFEATMSDGSSGVKPADISAFEDALKTADSDLDFTADDSLVTDGKGNFYIKNDKDADNVTYKKVDFSVAAGDDTTPSTITATIGETVAPATTDPLKVIDGALAQVDALRSGLGAVQNRFDSIINNLSSTVNNLSESRSRILDADFASEVSEMSRANILQSAGTTVLAQANQVPQNVLSLLR